MKQYKLWVVIEECDEDKDQHIDISDPIIIGAYDDKEQAFERADELFCDYTTKLN